MDNEEQTRHPAIGLSRRNFLEITSTALATAGLAALGADAQESQDTRNAEKGHSVDDPAQENRPLLDENPNSNMPPATDHGDIGPVWYSFDLVHKRVQEGVDSIATPGVSGWLGDWITAG
jgi:oxalate decarboxylase